MEKNFYDILSNNILTLRKKHNLTQEQLASKLGISFQAISKWENNITSPDIGYLPLLAEVFKVQIDQLFSEKLISHAIQDDGVTRIVVYKGDQLLSTHDSSLESIEVKLSGTANDVVCHANLCATDKLNIKGDVSVQGDLTAENINCGSVNVKGDFNVESMSTGSVNCQDLNTDRLSSGSIVSQGDLKAYSFSTGSLNAYSDIHTDNIKCNGVIQCQGDIKCKQAIIAKKIEAKNIDGEISYQEVE